MDCKYCGKPDTPARQVPVGMPVSECYCADCVETCRAEYQPMLEAARGGFCWPDGKAVPREPGHELSMIVWNWIDVHGPPKAVGDYLTAREWPDCRLLAALEWDGEDWLDDERITRRCVVAWADLPPFPTRAK